MLKIRVTFTDNNKGQKELEKLISILEAKLDIINESKVYKGRGKTIYSSIYLDVEERD